MKKMVEIDVVFDENRVDPYVMIRTKERTRQVDNIIEAIESASENDFPVIPASDGDRIELLSQRDIVRVYTQGRKLIVQTDEGDYFVNRSLYSVGELLNPERFVQISQSEIINLYKVKCFEINVMGTIGIEFENGAKSWVSRSRVKAIKELLQKIR